MASDRPGSILTHGALLLILILYGVSLAIPAVGTCAADGSLHEAPSSIGWLASGWLGPLFGIFGWYANPMLLLAMKPLLDGKLPILAHAILPPLFAATILIQPQFNYLDSPTFYHFCHATIGLWAWIASLCVPLATTLIGRAADARWNLSSAGPASDRRRSSRAHRAVSRRRSRWSTKDHAPAPSAAFTR